MTMALSCFYANTHKHTSKPPRLQLVSSALSVVDALAETRQLNSPGLAFQTHTGGVTIVWLTPAKPTADSGTPAQFQISALFESPRKSVHRLNGTLNLFLLSLF